MGSLGDGSSGLINFSRISQPVVHEQQHQQQTWIPPKFGMTPASAVGNVVSLLPFPGKDAALDTQNCAADVQAHTLFGVNIDSSSSLIPNQAPNLVGAAIENEESSLPFADSAYQNSLVNGVNDPTTLLQNDGQSDVANGSFVKVTRATHLFRNSICSISMLTWKNLATTVGLQGGMCWEMVRHQPVQQLSSAERRTRSDVWH